MLFPSALLLIQISSCTQVYQVLQLCLRVTSEYLPVCYQWVPSCVLSPPSYLATCSGAVIYTFLFLWISTIDESHSSPPRIEDLFLSQYLASHQSIFKSPKWETLYRFFLRFALWCIHLHYWFMAKCIYYTHTHTHTHAFCNSTRCAKTKNFSVIHNTQLLL
jgi:hypothetical protein